MTLHISSIRHGGTPCCWVSGVDSTCMRRVYIWLSLRLIYKLGAPKIRLESRKATENLVHSKFVTRNWGGGAGQTGQKDNVLKVKSAAELRPAMDLQDYYPPQTLCSPRSQASSTFAGSTTPLIPAVTTSNLGPSAFQPVRRLDSDKNSRP